MATGDPQDMLARLRRYLPARWFGFDADPWPVVDAVLAGLAAILSHAHTLIAFAGLQTRVATATGGFLELAAYEIAEFDLPRFHGESDADYSLRVRKEPLRQRNTRAAIDAAVYDITGRHPAIFEGEYGPIMGGYGVPGFGWGVGGWLWGSSTAPAHVMVKVVKPVGFGIPYRGGWGSGTGGYGAVGNFSFIDDTLIVGKGASMSDILKAIDRVRAAGVRVIVVFTDELGNPV